MLGERGQPSRAGAVDLGRQEGVVPDEISRQELWRGRDKSNVPTSSERLHKILYRHWLSEHPAAYRTRLGP